MTKLFVFCVDLETLDLLHRDPFEFDLDLELILFLLFLPFFFFTNLELARSEREGDNLCLESLEDACISFLKVDLRLDSALFDKLWERVSC